MVGSPQSTAPSPGESVGGLLCESPVMEVEPLKFRQLWMDVSGESL
jgi:hypothetical protein